MRYTGFDTFYARILGIFQRWIAKQTLLIFICGIASIFGAQDKIYGILVAPPSMLRT